MVNMEMSRPERNCHKIGAFGADVDPASALVKIGLSGCVC
jgi:hypothetical protein